MAARSLDSLIGGVIGLLVILHGEVPNSAGVRGAQGKTCRVMIVLVCAFVLVGA